MADVVKYNEMYSIFQDVMNDVNACLCFGPCNSKVAEKIKNQSVEPTFSFFRPALPFQPKSTNEHQAAQAIFSYSRLYSYDLGASRNTNDLTHLVSIALQGFLSGTGTCETYAILGAYYLRQKYHFEVSIENIHSHLTHTYLVVHANPDYIFDFWSGILVRHGNWSEWNEAVNTEYAYRSGVTRFSAVAQCIPGTFLNTFSDLFTDDENIRLRESHVDLIHSFTSSPVLSGARI